MEPKIMFVGELPASKKKYLVRKSESSLRIVCPSVKNLSDI